MDRLIKIGLALAAVAGIGAAAVHGQSEAAPKCGTVVVSKSTVADLPALIADAECFGRAAASASSSQVYRLEKAKELAAKLAGAPPVVTPTPSPIPTPSPGGPVRPDDLVKPRPEKLTVTAFSPYSGDEVAVIERYRPAFAAMGYTIGHYTDYEGCTETEETVCYTWWAAKSADLDNTVQTVDFTAPRLWQYGGNLYGQIESETAAKQLLVRVMKAEGY